MRRDIAPHVSVVVLVLLLIPVFLHLKPAACHLRQAYNIRILLLIQLRCNRELSLSLIYEHVVPVCRDISCHLKCPDRLFVHLTVVQLPADVLHRALPPFLKPGGQLLRTVLAEIAIRQLSVSKKSDLASADAALLFFKHLSK